MPGPPLSEREIRSLVRKAGEEKRLPVMLVHDVDAGYGRGGECAVCAQAISSSQVVYEVCDSERRRLIFHMMCYAEWQLECGQRIRKQSRLQL